MHFFRPLPLACEAIHFKAGSFAACAPFHKSPLAEAAPLFAPVGPTSARTHAVGGGGERNSIGLKYARSLSSRLRQGSRSLPATQTNVPAPANQKGLVLCVAQHDHSGRKLARQFQSVQQFPISHSRDQQTPRRPHKSLDIQSRFA